MKKADREITVSGFIKVIWDRVRMYAQSINTLMLAYLFIKEAGFHWWYLLIIGGFTLFLLYDYFFIFGQERDVLWVRSAIMDKLRKQVDAIYNYLDIENQKGE